ncbi:MAG: hypothetical protein ACREJR_04815 [Candidatus Rokuibacteriota bacterium]
MIMLLGILALGLAVGRWSRRISPTLDLLLLLGVALAVAGQLVAWQAGLVLDLDDLLRGPGAVDR